MCLNWEDALIRICLVLLHLSEINFSTCAPFLQPELKLSWRPRFFFLFWYSVKCLVWCILLVRPAFHIHKIRDTISYNYNFFSLHYDPLYPMLPLVSKFRLLHPMFYQSLLPPAPSYRMKRIMNLDGSLFSNLGVLMKAFRILMTL